MSKLITLCAVAASLTCFILLFTRGEASFNFGRQQPPRNHTLIIGKPTYKDRLLFHTVVLRPALRNRQVSVEVAYPVPGHRPQAIISCIRAIDHWNNGTGGFPYLTKGGIGQRNATIKIISNYNLGFNFTVEILGH